MLEKTQEEAADVYVLWGRGSLKHCRVCLSKAHDVLVTPNRDKTLWNSRGKVEGCIYVCSNTSISKLEQGALLRTGSFQSNKPESALSLSVT